MDQPKPVGPHAAQIALSYLYHAAEMSDCKKKRIDGYRTVLQEFIDQYK